MKEEIKIKKKLLIFLPIFVIILSIIIVSGATGASSWFFDQDTSEGNTINAGTVDPEIQGTPFTISNAKPGIWSDPSETITFFNNSTLTIKYRISAERISESVGGFYDLINMKVERKEGNSWNEYYNGKVKGLSIGSGECGAMSSVTSGNSHEWRVYLQVDESAGNSYQEANCSFNLVFESTQDNNPGWSE